MKHRLLLVWLLCLGGFFSFGQKSIVLVNPPNTLCADTDVALSFTSNLALQSGSVFRLQLRRYIDQFTGGSFREFPAVADGSVLRVRFPDPRALGIGSSDLSSEFQYRIVSSNPSGDSDWVSLRFSYRPQLSSVVATPGAVNPDEGTPVEFTISGSAPVTVTFGDSSRLDVSPPFSSDIAFRTTVPFYSDRSQTYRVANVRNECGLGTGSGQFEVKVNPFSLRITSVSPTNLCEGSTLLLRYSTQGGTLQPGNQFRVVLTPVNSGSSFPIPATVTLDATEENGILKAPFPKNTPFDQGRQYTVRLLASQPELTSPPAPDGTIRLWPEPAAELTTASGTFNFNAGTSLSVRFRGAPPFRAELSSGLQVSTNDSFSQPVTAFVSVQAQKTTDYRIVSFTSGCGGPPRPGQNTTRFEVLPGMVIDSLPSQSPEPCEGQTITVRLRSNLPLTPATTYTVRVRQSRNLSGGWLPVEWSVPARVEGTRLTFTLPMVGAADPARGVPSGTSYEMWVETQNPGAVSGSSYLSIRSKPTVAFAPGAPFYSPFNNQVTLRLDPSGGGPYTVTLADSSAYTMFGELTLPVFETTTFRVVSINNGCGTTNANLSATVSVTPTAGIALRPRQVAACKGETLRMAFQAYGSFAGSNQFRVQVRRNYGEWTNVQTLNGASGVFALQPDAGNYEVRVAATEPVYFSNSFSFSIKELPTATITSGSTTILAGDTWYPSYSQFSGGEPYTLIVTDGTRDVPYYTFGGSIGFSPERTTTYRVKSVSNACGTRTLAEGEGFTVRVEPLRVTSLNMVRQLCVGAPVSATVVAFGRINPETRFSLYLTEANDTSKTVALIAEGIGSLLNGTVPAAVPAGTYSLKIVAANPSLVIHLANTSATITTPPTAVLAAPDGASEIQTAQTAQLRVTLTGGPLYTLLFSDNVNQQVSFSPHIRSLTPQRGTTYTLRRVYNACGYGTVSGQVRVRVTPTLQLSRITSTQTCPGRVVRVQFQGRGDYEPGNIFRLQLVNARNQVIARLDSTVDLSRELQLNLPGNLQAGSYLIQATSTRPVLSASTSIAVQVPPVVRLLGSGAVINPGRTVYLSLTHANPTPGAFSTIRYTLSSGTSGIWESFQGPSLSVPVSPTATTTYTLASVSNECGVGSASGSVLVTVNPSAERTVDIPVPGFFDNRLCLGDTVQVTFETRGTFTPTNRFTVQLSDSTGANFADVTTLGTASPLRAVVPTGTPRGAGYRLRVVASDAGTQSGTSPYAYIVRQRATAVFDTDVLNFLPGTSVRILIRFTGDSPWTYNLASTAGGFSRFTSRTPDTLTIQPALPSLSYRLTSVSNGCGTGIVGSPGTLRVELITALEPTAVPLRVFPNPTTERIRLDGFTTPTNVDLFAPTGALLRRVRSAGEVLELDVSPLPSGVYLLRVEHGSGPVTYRIVKE